MTIGKKRKEKDLLSTFDDSPECSEEAATKERLQKARVCLETILDTDSKELDKQLLADRFRQAAMKASGRKTFDKIATSFQHVQFDLRQTLRSNHRNHPITRLCGTSNDAFFSADKSGRIIKWTINDEGSFRKQHVFRASSKVLSLAVSPDCRFLLAGLSDGNISAWDARTNRPLGQLGPYPHREAVTSICFQPDTDPHSFTAYSASSDRTVKVWTVGSEQLSYIDTLFGHQDVVMSICSPSQDRCVSVGGRDRTVRLFKITEESQLVFRMSENDGGSLDEVVCARTGTASLYTVTASDAGVISLWTPTRKKPVQSVQGHSAPITLLYSPEMSDLVVSGSSDGLLRLWHLEGNGLKAVNELAIPGHITGALLSNDKLIVAVSPEGRFGRWTVDNSIKSSILVFDIN